jgi:hypothetical protein
VFREFHYLKWEGQYLKLGPWCLRAQTSYENKMRDLTTYKNKRRNMAKCGRGQHVISVNE